MFRRLQILGGLVGMVIVVGTTILLGLPLRPGF
jgi:hypothetical protein